MPGGTQQLGPRHHRIEDTKQDNPAGTADIAGVGTCRYSTPLSGRLLLAHRSYLALSGSVPRRPPSLCSLVQETQSAGFRSLVLGSGVTLAPIPRLAELEISEIQYEG